LSSGSRAAVTIFLLAHQQAGGGDELVESLALGIVLNPFEQVWGANVFTKSPTLEISTVGSPLRSTRKRSFVVNGAVLAELRAGREG
jgi:hypothetical protein